jgi:hypothetical protein
MIVVVLSSKKKCGRVYDKIVRQLDELSDDEQEKVMNALGYKAQTWRYPRFPSH